MNRVVQPEKSLFSAFTFVLAALLSGCSSLQQAALKTPTGLIAREHDGNSVTKSQASNLVHTLTQPKIGTAVTRSLPVLIEASGELQPNGNAVTRVSAPVSGKVASIAVSVGEKVRPHQVLATISSNEIGGMVTDLFKTETEIESDLSKDLLDIDYDYKQASAEQSLVERQYDRTKILLEERIASISSLETLQTELDKHTLTLKALNEKRARTIAVSQKRRDVHRLALRQKLRMLGMSEKTISSIMTGGAVINTIPIETTQGGFVLERNVNLAELVDSSKTLFVVDDIDTLWLVADIYERDIQNVHEGQNVKFTVDSFPKQEFSGKLDFVAGTVKPESRTLAVRAVIQNPSGKLKPKMFARMAIHANDRVALCVPKSAVQDAGSQKVVYVQVGPDSFDERAVVTGLQSDKFIEITHGLNAGEHVVIDGTFDLRSLASKQSY